MKAKCVDCHVNRSKASGLCDYCWARCLASEPMNSSRGLQIQRRVRAMLGRPQILTVTATPQKPEQLAFL